MADETKELPPTKKIEAPVEEEKDVYVCEDGLRVKVKQIPPMLLQKVLNSVEMPERPTYEARTISGRTEIWPLDEESAKQVERGESRWEYYEEVRTQRQNEQNERVTMAAFLFGTECEIPENGWDRKQEFLGLTVPTDPDERKAHYLATELPAQDIANLMNRIMGTLQLPEGVIEDAQNSFQRSVRD